MTRYLKIFAHLISLSFRKMLVYRTTSILIVVFSTLFLAAETLSVLVFFEFTDSIMGHSKDEFLFLLATATIILSLYQFVFVLQHEELADIIIEGELDYHLLRPMDSQFQANVFLFDIPSLLNLIPPIAIIIHLSLKGSLVYSPLNVLLYLVYIAGGFFQYYCINQFFVTLAFFFERAYKLAGLPEYLFDFALRPRRVYPKYLQILLGYVFPLLLITNLPTEIMLGSPSTNLLLYSLFISVILFAIVRIQWKICLKRYESASS